MKINPPQKRIEFERILRKIGYKNRMPVSLEKYSKYEEVLKCLNKNEIEIYIFVRKYKNKKSYLYEFFIQNYNHMSKQQMIVEIKNLCKQIILREERIICEVGWEIIDIKNRLRYWNKKDKLNLFISSIILIKIKIKYGVMDLKPIEGDILISHPEGGKSIYFHEKAMMIGSLQRSTIHKKFGFGELKANNSQYGRYNENLDLIPI